MYRYNTTELQKRFLRTETETACDAMLNFGAGTSGTLHVSCTNTRTYVYTIFLSRRLEERSARDKAISYVPYVRLLIQLGASTPPFRAYAL